MSRIADGKVWCQACHRWLDSQADYRRHRPQCPSRAQQVEYRGLAGKPPAPRKPAPPLPARRLA
jgi:hypothetical protein